MTTEPQNAASVWVLCIPDYDNYDFTLYATREAAMSAIRMQVGNATGEWVETFGGDQVEFHERTLVRGLCRGKRVWSLTEADVYA